MNKDELLGDWNQIKGKVREKWGDLTDDDLDRVAGKRDQLIGKIQERYGRTREDVERELDEFTKDWRDDTKH
jgi:uncharacterized protein YjbJ (UPF0337 family)